MGKQAGFAVIEGHFEEGSKVEAVPRPRDVFADLPAEATSTVKGGRVEFTGLLPHGAYWAVGKNGDAEVKVMFSARSKEFEDLSPDEREQAHQADIDATTEAESKQRLEHGVVPAAPLPEDEQVVTTGARTTASAKPVVPDPTTEPGHALLTDAEELARETPTVDNSVSAVDGGETAKVTAPADESEPEPENEKGTGPYKGRTVAQLRRVATDKGIKGASRLKKSKLLKELKS